MSRDETEREEFERRSVRVAQEYGIRPACPDCRCRQEGDFPCPDIYCRNSPDGRMLEIRIGTEADCPDKVFRLRYERVRYYCDRSLDVLFLRPRERRAVVTYLWRRTLPPELSPMQRLTVLLSERQSRARIVTPELEALGHVGEP